MGSLPSVTSYDVWRFRVEKKDSQGNYLPPVSVQMKGKTFEGFINEGDIVRIDKKWKEGQLLKPNKLFNVSGGIWIKAN